MDKYQEVYFENGRLLVFSVNDLDYKESGKNFSIDTIKDALKIKQDSDITKTQYKLTVKKGLFVKSISLLKNGKWEECNNKIAIIDFEDRAEKIKISFEDDIVDPYEMSIEYIEADKEAYFKKKKEENLKNLIEKASIKAQTGDCLVNIYFQPCSKDYSKTEITLYKNDQMLAIYEVEKNRFFQAITNLAYDRYQFVLKQFDKNDNILLETEKYYFTIVNKSDYDGPLSF